MSIYELYEILRYISKANLIYYLKYLYYIYIFINILLIHVYLLNIDINTLITELILIFR